VLFGTRRIGGVTEDERFVMRGAAMGCSMTMNHDRPICDGV